MSNNISYSFLVNTCQTLNNFAEARSLPTPNKEIILVIKEIEGKKVLQAVQKNEVTDNWNLTRMGKDWNATLHAVAKYLQDNEPYLPSFSCLNKKSLMSCYYNQDTVHTFQTITKETWRSLQLQKANGYEIFKQCIIAHNKKNQLDVYLVFKENEKKSFLEKTYTERGLSYSLPNPMGLHPSVDEKIIRLRYQTPNIESDQFLYLSPFYRNHKQDIPAKVLGFCYEYGLGAKKNVEQAKIEYKKAANEDEFSACYNLGRLYLKSNPIEAIKFLEKGELILKNKIKTVEESLANNSLEVVKKYLEESLKEEKEMLETKEREFEAIVEKEDYEIEELKETKESLIQLSTFVITQELIEEKQDSHVKVCMHFIKKWNKPLKKIQSLLSEAIQLLR